MTVGTDVTTLAWDYNDKLTGITYPNSSAVKDLDCRVRTGRHGSASTQFHWNGAAGQPDSVAV